jgi:hypothetical protein
MCAERDHGIAAILLLHCTAPFHPIFDHVVNSCQAWPTLCCPRSQPIRQRHFIRLDNGLMHQGRRRDSMLNRMCDGSMRFVTVAVRATHSDRGRMSGLEWRRTSLEIVADPSVEKLLKATCSSAALLLGPVRDEDRPVLPPSQPARESGTGVTRSPRPDSRPPRCSVWSRDGILGEKPQALEGAVAIRMPIAIGHLPHPL